MRGGARWKKHIFEIHDPKLLWEAETKREKNTKNDLFTMIAHIGNVQSWGSSRYYPKLS